MGSWLGCIILVTIFTISGCANKPNLIPYGYSEIFEASDRAKIAAKVDYPILVAPCRGNTPLVCPKLDPSVCHPGDDPLVCPGVEPNNAKQIMIRWTKKGEIIWNRPFWDKITWWRFAMFSERDASRQLNNQPDGVPALCATDWTASNEEDTEVKLPCEFDVLDHLAIPLVGILDYRLGGDKTQRPGESDTPDGVARSYYIVGK
jgi:hypothetical protein